MTSLIPARTGGSGGGGGVTPAEMAAAIAASTASETYRHTQAVPATVWTVDHNLGRHPVVNTTTTAGDRMWTAIHHVDNVTLTCTLLTAQAGFAECS